MNIYVASSWRNEQQQQVVAALRDAGHEVYDFKNPPESKGFDWADIDGNWQQWTNAEYRSALNHPLAEKGFMNDFNAMQLADICVMVMPCGRSAHVEAGWMQGAGKPTIILQEKEAEAELMYKMFELVTDSLDEIIHHLSMIEMSYREPIECKPLGTPLTIGALKQFIEPYLSDTSFGFRNQPMQQLFEIKGSRHVCIAFQPQYECEHNWKFDYNDSHYNYYICTMCGQKDKS